VDNAGSSSDICIDDYRGPQAFSENETKAIKELLDTYKNIRIAMNFHAYGNLMIHPFNYEIGGNTNLDKPEFADAKLFYEDIWKNGGFPTGNVKGNGA